MWPCKFSRNVESEISWIFQLFVSKFHSIGCAWFYQLFLEDWFKDSVDSFANVLQQDRNPNLDSILEFHLNLFGWFSLSEDDQVRLFLHVLDPIISLDLGIYHQWPPSRILQDNRIVDGEVIVW